MVIGSQKAAREKAVYFHLRLQLQVSLNVSLMQAASQSVQAEDCLILIPAAIHYTFQNNKFCSL
jgi:hypothetical protein